MEATDKLKRAVKPEREREREKRKRLETVARSYVKEFKFQVVKNLSCYKKLS
jgi:hypothetical protein